MVGVNPQTKPGKKCERCGWSYPGFHVCIDMSDPDAQRVVLSPVQKAQNKVDRYSGNMSSETRARISAAASERWAAHHEANASRDAEMARLYKEVGLSVRQLEAKFSLSHNTVLTVLHKARDQGLLVMRPPNFTKSSI